MSVGNISFQSQINTYCPADEEKTELHNAPFGTGHCFWFLHEQNIACSANVRGMINQEYNHMLIEWQLSAHAIPGGEDLDQLGMDQTTCIVRPDLYMKAYKRVLSDYIQPVPSLNIQIITQNFFDLLQQTNDKHQANVRSLINFKYNMLLKENQSQAKQIPSSGLEDYLEKLGMNEDTELQADLYFQAYEEILSVFETIPVVINPLDLNQVMQSECERILNIWQPNDKYLTAFKKINPFVWIFYPYEDREAVYLPNTNKIGEKALIARQPTEDKQIGKDLKTSLKIAIDAKIQLDGKPIESMQMNQMLLQYRVQLKNDQRTLDTYEFYATSSYNYSPEWYRDPIICIKNNQQCVEFSTNDVLYDFIKKKAFFGFICKGNQLEFFERKVTYARKASYWDNWWQEKCMNADVPIDTYQKRIYPTITSAVFNILRKLNQESGNTSPTILEIGGGNGLLAEKIVKSDAYPINAHYTFLELSAPSLEHAKTLLAGHQVELFQTNLISDDSYGNLPEGCVDIAIGSGILTHQVLESQQDALIVLRKVDRYLKSGGYLVLAGLGKSLLESTDFEKEGFEVINCTVGEHQLYIVKKK